MKKRYIHIADAPAHGSIYCGRNNHNEVQHQLSPLIQRITLMGIKVYAFQINNRVKKSFEVCKSIHKGEYFIKDFSQMSYDNISSNFSSYIVESAIYAAPKKEINI